MTNLEDRWGGWLAQPAVESIWALTYAPTSADRSCPLVRAARGPVHGPYWRSALKAAKLENSCDLKVAEMRSIVRQRSLVYVVGDDASCSPGYSVRTRRRSSTPYCLAVILRLSGLWRSHRAVVLISGVFAAVGLAITVIWPITDLIASHDVGVMANPQRALSALP
jgi:hypothetical protein